MPEESIAAILRREMERAGLRPIQLARKAGVPPASLSRHLHGHRVPDLPILRRYAKALGLGLDALMPP